MREEDAMHYQPKYLTSTLWNEKKTHIIVAFLLVVRLECVVVPD